MILPPPPQGMECAANHLMITASSSAFSPPASHNTHNALLSRLLSVDVGKERAVIFYVRLDCLRIAPLHFLVYGLRFNLEVYTYPQCRPRIEEGREAEREEGREAGR